MQDQQCTGRTSSVSVRRDKDAGGCTRLSRLSTSEVAAPLRYAVFGCLHFTPSEGGGGQLSRARFIPTCLITPLTQRCLSFHFSHFPYRACITIILLWPLDPSVSSDIFSYAAFFYRIHTTPSNFISLTHPLPVSTPIFNYAPLLSPSSTNRHGPPINKRPIVRCLQLSICIICTPFIWFNQYQI